ncbi:hypothetical protein ACOKFD_13995 [Flagellimonas sp. S174]|uniref:hypothetical protein n=1 Tax=Flagellimonas sp. S174 TaxID=3410790 RepID=UPI003BF4B1E8
MKTVFNLKKYVTYSLILALSVFPIYSCSSDSDEPPVEPDGSENPDPVPPEEIKVQTLASNFGATDGLSIDANGIVYGSNFNQFMGTQVVSFNPESASVEVAVDNLVAPLGNVVDSSGNIFVVHNVRPIEPGSNQTIGDVIRIDSENNRTTLATLPGFPAGITLDEEGNVYVSNFSFPGIHKIDTDGEVSVYVQDALLAGGVGIAFDSSGDLFVGNFVTGAILKIDIEKSIEVITTIPTVRQGFVIGYITLLGDTIYATAVEEHVIYKVSLTGETSIFAGSGTQSTTEGSLLGATFDTPNGIVGDANKNVLYITQTNGALRQIDLD